ncbi:putative uncharacterized protein [Clostridium sp. CAG:967]|nr:putative uncharacterized protein [Clostridium sp. CAG:967]
MSANKDLRKLLLEENKTIKQLADMASQIAGKSITQYSISQKLNRNSMKYDEVQFLAGVLGYEIEFKKIK